MAQVTLNHNPPRRKPQLTSTEYLSTYFRKGSNLPVFAAAAIFIFALAMYSEDIISLANEYSFQLYNFDQDYFPHQQDQPTPFVAHHTHTIPVEEAARANESQQIVARAPESTSCDLANGHWVFDNASRPLYREDECEFMSIQMSCLKNGRLDDRYQKWRWQPKDCSLPRFDAKLFLEKLRGKRVMFVGDSLNRNQWQSLVCMVQSALTKGKKSRKINGSRIIFTAEEYNVSLEFYWAPFLVESNSDDPEIHSIDTRIIKPNSIEKHAQHWKHVDYLVFNTYIWWMNDKEIRVLRPKARDWTRFDRIKRVIAFERVLKTWSSWVEQNVDPKRTRVFFMSMSPLHSKSKQWNNTNGIKCSNETEPLTSLAGVDLGTNMKLFEVAKKVSLSTKRVPIDFIDITKMSSYRKDAHTSVYTVKQGKLLTKEQQKDPQTYADCIHWCTPGVPDTWNEVLYARIMFNPFDRAND